MRWPLIVVRTVLTWVVGFFATLICALMAVLISLIKDTSPLVEVVIRTWSRSWLIAAGVRLDVEGREHVDPDRSYMVVANHQSALDIMACFLAVPVPIRFLAKKELFRLPILAMGMRAVGIIEVDREARGTIHQQVNVQARDLIDKKRSVIIFPEGTRPRDGVMRPFKKGAFTMANTMGLPILPLSVHGTYQAWRPASPWIKGGPIRVVIHSPIETADRGKGDTGALRDQAYQTISEQLTAQS